MAQAEFDRIGAGRERQLVHEALEREHVHVGAERHAAPRPARGMSGNEVMDDPGVGEPVERNGVAVAAARRLRDRLGGRLRETASARCHAGIRLPAPPGRVECALLHTS